MAIDKVIETDNKVVGDILVMTCGGEWRNSTEEEDKMSHVDIWYTNKHGKTIGIDIKRESRISRQDLLPSTKYHWIQLRNKYGGKGALFGENELFAFMIDRSVMLVSRRNIVSFFERNVPKDVVYVKNPMIENVIYNRALPIEDRVTHEVKKDSIGIPIMSQEMMFMIRRFDLFCLSFAFFRFDGMKWNEIRGYGHDANFVNRYIDNWKLGSMDDEVKMLMDEYTTLGIGDL